jgi:hypothetical protein
LEPRIGLYFRECERFGGDLWDPADRPEDIATVMVAKLSKNKAAAVGSAILKVLKEKHRIWE